MYTGIRFQQPSLKTIPQRQVTQTDHVAFEGSSPQDPRRRHHSNQATPGQRPPQRPQPYPPQRQMRPTQPTRPPQQGSPPLNKQNLESYLRGAMKAGGLEGSPEAVGQFMEEILKREFREVDAHKVFEALSNGNKVIATTKGEFFEKFAEIVQEIEDNRYEAGYREGRSAEKRNMGSFGKLQRYAALAAAALLTLTYAGPTITLVSNVANGGDPLGYLTQGVIDRIEQVTDVLPSIGTTKVNLGGIELEEIEPFNRDVSNQSEIRGFGLLRAKQEDINILFPGGRKEINTNAVVKIDGQVQTISVTAEYKDLNQVSGDRVIIYKTVGFNEGSDSGLSLPSINLPWGNNN